MMEVVIISEVKVVVRVVSPYTADVKNHVVKDPFSSDVAELQKCKRKYDSEEVIERTNPNFYLKAFPDVKEQSSTVVNDDSEKEQSSVGIPLVATYSNGRWCEQLETNVGDHQHAQSTDTVQISTYDGSFFLDQDRVQIKNKETMDNEERVVKVELIQNLLNENQITVGHRSEGKDNMSSPFPESTTTGEISSIDESQHVIVLENKTCDDISAVQCSNVDLLVNATCKEIQSPRLVKTIEKDNSKEISAVHCSNVDLLVNARCEEISAVSKSPCVNSIKNATPEETCAVDQSPSLVKIFENEKDNSKEISAKEISQLFTVPESSEKEISAINQSPSDVGSKHGHNIVINKHDKGPEVRKSPRHIRRKTWKVMESNQCKTKKRNGFNDKLSIKQESTETGNSMDIENLGNSTEKESRHLQDISEQEDNIEANLQDDGLDSNTADKFKCNVCNITFVSNRCLQRHFTTPRHINKEKLGGKERRFKCDICFKDFGRNSTLQKHKMIHNNERPFECSYCKHRFRQKTTMKQHMLIHTGEKQFKCQVCDKEFRREYELKDHTMVHTGEKPFECSTCQKRFSRKQNLVNHEKLHTNNRNFMCEICGKGFTCNNNLQTHIKIHTEGKTHVCETCGKGFNQKHQLVRHAMIHSSMKPFVCEICGFQTADPDTLRCHNRRHTGERPFSCDLCDRKFRKKNTLRRHQIIHQRGPKKRGRKFSDVIKVYPCQICGKNFLKNSRLTRHMKTHERKMQPTQVVIENVEQLEHLDADQFSTDGADIIVLTF